MTKTYNISFKGEDLVVRTTDGRITTVLIDDHSGYTSILRVLHPEYLKEIKKLLL